MPVTRGAAWRSITVCFIHRKPFKSFKIMTGAVQSCPFHRSGNRGSEKQTTVPRVSRQREGWVKSLCLLVQLSRPCFPHQNMPCPPVPTWVLLRGGGLNRDSYWKPDTSPILHKMLGVADYAPVYVWLPW